MRRRLSFLFFSLAAGRAPPSPRDSPRRAAHEPSPQLERKIIQLHKDAHDLEPLDEEWLMEVRRPKTTPRKPGRRRVRDAFPPVPFTAGAA